MSILNNIILSFSIQPALIKQRDRLFFKDGLFLVETELVPFLLLMAKNISMKTEPKLTETFAQFKFLLYNELPL